MLMLSPLFWVLGYLSGSLPFAVWITRWTRGVDVREGGSGHMTTTNTIRQAGWLAGALVFLLDTAKGFLPVYAAIHLGQPGWSIALTAALAVVGHCWPVFARFRGGRGLAAAGGILLATAPLGFLLAVGILLTFLLLTRHAARSGLFTALVLPLGLWLAGLRGLVIWTMIPAGLVIAGRFAIDWNRKYRELWLDREKQAGS
jgi:acyl phosphate:glycerol-3-phosphate acyltransferase